MAELKRETINGYVDLLGKDLRKRYSIDEKFFQNHNIKRALRNDDGSGVTVGVTAIGSVQGYHMVDGDRIPQEGHLYYRGIDLNDIINAHQEIGNFGYEETSYLLLMGELPDREQADCFQTILSNAHQLPVGFTEDMILKAPSRNIMNKLGSCILNLYSYDENPDDISPENLLRQSIELIGRLPVIAANAYNVKKHYYDGQSLYIHIPKENLSVAETFLRMIRPDKVYTPEEAHMLDLMLIMHAEHGGGNNSAFSCRCLSSTGTDTYSAISAAVGSLKGPLHGGANASVMQMFMDIKDHIHDPKDDEEIRAYLAKILDGNANDGSGKIYGLGHAVYTMSDPRATLVKKNALKLAQEKGCMEDFMLLQKIEQLGVQLIMSRRHSDMPLCANVDFYSGMVYRMLDIPVDLYTPLFAIARISGWCAHRMEEILSCGRIMRPAYKAAVLHAPYIPMDQR